MASTRHERDYRRARTLYVAAVNQLRQAAAAWRSAEVPMEPDARGEVPAWSDEQIRATVALASAWVALMKRRHAYESVSRAYHNSPW